MQKDFDVAFLKSDESRWSRFLAENPTSLFYLDREYLRHVDQEWTDMSVVISQDGRDVALLPCAWSRDRTTVVSHPGTTFGSFHFANSVSGLDVVLIVRTVLNFLRTTDVEKVSFRIPPAHMTNWCVEEATYALLEAGGDVRKPKLSAVISLTDRRKISTLRRRTLTRAERSGLTYVYGSEQDLVEHFYQMLCNELMARYQARPVHSLNELTRLIDLVRDKVVVHAAYLNDEIVGGVLVFDYGNCWRFQYISSNESGRTLGAIDFVFERTMQSASDAGVLWIDLGTSNGTPTGVLNETLYNFKSGFGSFGVLNYEIELSLR